MSEDALAVLTKKVEQLSGENAALRKALGVRSAALFAWTLLATGIVAIVLATYVEERSSSRIGSPSGPEEVTLLSKDGQRFVRLRAKGATGLAVGEADGAESVERLRLSIDDSGLGQLVLEGRARSGVVLRAPADGPGEVETNRLVLSDHYGHDRAVLRLDESGRVVLDHLGEDGQVVGTSTLDR